MMEIRIKTGSKLANISILNTYAHPNNYTDSQILDFWTNINSYIASIPRKLIRIWRTDNNGQVIRKMKMTNALAPGFYKQIAQISTVGNLP